MEIKMRPYDDKDYEDFAKNFFAYFNEMGLGLSYDVIREKIVDEQILPNYRKDILSIDLATLDDKLIGFIIYQIDTKDSDWCEREGWGFLREFYVMPPVRKYGIGSHLLVRAENILRNHGAENIYLTTNNQQYVKDFYTKHGYILEGKTAKNECEYMSKDLIKISN